MTAGEAGADYVSFGPLSGPDEMRADHELFAWWTEMIELPVVAEGALSIDLARQLAPVTDFFGIGEEIWREDVPAKALAALIAAAT